MMKHNVIAGLVLVTLLPASVLADEHDASTFFELLAGRYDSLAHKLEDEAAGMDEEEVHGWVTRAFVPIAAPTLPGPAAVATVMYNGPDGLFDEGEFQLWIVTPGEAPGSVLMTPHGFRDPDAYRESASDPEAFADLSVKDLVAPHGAAGCAIVWQREGSAWTGYTAPETCTSISTQMNVELAWEWNFRLTAEAMWIDFAGYGPDGDMVYGRADRTPWRLDRQF